MTNAIFIIKSRRHLLHAIVLAALMAGGLTVTPAMAQNTLVPEGETSPYIATAFPDRIVLTATADPAHAQTVNWRTRSSVNTAYAQITKATGSPHKIFRARRRRWMRTTAWLITIM